MTSSGTPLALETCTKRNVNTTSTVGKKKNNALISNYLNPTRSITICIAFLYHILCLHCVGSSRTRWLPTYLQSDKALQRVRPQVREMTAKFSTSQAHIGALSSVIDRSESGAVPINIVSSHVSALTRPCPVVTKTNRSDIFSRL
jgi:hypothetical protein